ncbi:MAG: zinc-ribbon domain-containing protein [Lachnospiraceae bacterium]|nr:zinc-ribbon domain-containing protein [Lachnospiraceae bacterium]
MFCIYCGQKLDDNVRFCPYCGKPTGVGPKPVAEPKPVETAGSGIPLEEERTVEIPVAEESNPAARQEAEEVAPATEPLEEESNPAARQEVEEVAPATEPLEEESNPTARQEAEEVAPATEPVAEERIPAVQQMAEEVAPATEPAEEESNPTARQEAEEVAPATQPAAEPQFQAVPPAGNVAPGQQQAGMGSPQGYAGPYNTLYVANQPGQPKKSHKGIAIAVAGAAVVCMAVCGIGGVYLLTRNPMRHNAMVMSEDGEFSLLKDISKEDPKECTFAGDSDSNCVFSEDGKYFYFFKDVSDDRGDLCKIKVSSLGSDKSDNKKKVTEIESGIKVSNINRVGKNGILYMANDDLKYYDGDDSITLDDGVTDIAANDDDKVIYWSGTYDDMDLKVATIGKDPEKKDIDENVNQIYRYDVDHLVYEKDMDENSVGTLCVANSDGKVKEVSKGAKMFGSTVDEDIWYGKPKTTSVSLYDYVEDDKLAEDQKVNKPEMKDYMRAVKFSEMKTNYSKPALIREVKKQIRKTNGYYVFYFLSHYDKFYAYSPSSNKFYRFNKKKYQKAEEDYRQIQRRNDLRKSLKNEKQDTTYYELYYYNKGDSTQAKDKVLDARPEGKVALYKPYDTAGIKKVGKLSDFHFASEISYKVNYGSATSSTDPSDIKAKVSVAGKGGKDLDVTYDNATIDTWKDKVILTEDQDGKSVLTLYSVEKEQLEKEKELSDNGCVAEKTDDKLFYVTDLGSDQEGNLYSYDGDDTDEVASDINRSCCVRELDKEEYLILSKDDLLIAKDGDQDDLEENVDFAEISEDQEILYLTKDGDLYSCTDKKKGQRIADGVKDFLLFKGRMLFNIPSFDEN